MCRFLVYTGAPVLLHDLLYRPEHSLVAQSHGSREQPVPLNADGFGVGWYAPDVSPLPGVVRSIQPALNIALTDGRTVLVPAFGQASLVPVARRREGPET